MAKNLKNLVLDVNDLHVSFDTYAGEVKAVRGVTFQLHEGEVLAIVGESGCGKSVTAQTVMKLNPMPPARIPQGQVRLGEHDIVKASEKEMQKLRGKEVSMIFQDPMTCLNPTKPVGKQIVEAIHHHRGISAAKAAKEAAAFLTGLKVPNAEEKAKGLVDIIQRYNNLSTDEAQKEIGAYLEGLNVPQAGEQAAQFAKNVQRRCRLSGAEIKEQAIKYLKLVNIPNAEERAKQYPHEFSGGMRQRAMIAMALSCNPKVLIADEPTTALDVTIQAQIMDLLAEIKEETNTAIILITHDLGVVAGMADRVAVMYAGKIVETGTVEDIFYRNSHPYTQALLKSLPTVDSDRKERLVSIAGTPPDLLAPPRGCAFAARCKHCMKICHEEQPPEFALGEGHSASCWLLHPDCPSAEERGEKDVD